jgi:hypothetical protein
MIRAVVHLLAIIGMLYSATRLDTSWITRVSAAWPNGCCEVSDDCAGELLCYSHPEARACGKTLVIDENGQAVEKTLYGYCNDRSIEVGSDDGGGMEDIPDGGCCD